MIRNILALLAGILVMGLTIAAVQVLGHLAYPPPAGIDPRDHEAMVALIPRMPVMALAMVVLAYAAGAFTGGFTAAKLARSRPTRLPWALATVLTALVVLNFVLIPYHPLWMMVAGVLVPYPFAMLGGGLAGGRRANQA